MKAPKQCKIIKPVPAEEWEYPGRMPEYWVEFTDKTPNFKAYAVELEPM